MGFKLNIGKDGGGGSTGFSLKQSLNMIKAKGMSSQMVGTDVMKDGYYNTVNESGAGSPAFQPDDDFNYESDMGKNTGIVLGPGGKTGMTGPNTTKKMPNTRDGKEVGDQMPGGGTVVNVPKTKNRSGVPQEIDVEYTNWDDDSPIQSRKRVKTANEIKKRGVDLRQGGQLVPTRGDLTKKQNREVLKQSVPADISSGKRRRFTDQDKAQMANTGNLLGSARAATNELERTRRGGKSKK